jgi:hypothetical protein
MTPSDKLFKLYCLALGDQFNTVVCAITHPPSEAQLTSMISCRRTEIYPLDSTAHDYVNSLKHRHAFLYEITAEGEGTFGYNLCSIRRYFIPVYFQVAVVV